MKPLARKMVDFVTHAFVLLLAIILLQTAKMDVADGRTVQASIPICLTVALLWLQAGMIKDWVESHVKANSDRSDDV